MLLLAAMCGGDEEAGGVELVAAQAPPSGRGRFGPKPPADQFLDGRPLVNHLAVAVLEFQGDVADFVASTILSAICSLACSTRLRERSIAAPRAWANPSWAFAN